jgi:benzoyl-CoA 2,3-dioxygenase component B
MTTSIDYSGKIPNNIGLDTDRRLQRALESWQPNFLNWWRDLGPAVFKENDIYLRTAVAVGREGWAHFDYVKMPDYRWGIFLAERDGERLIGHGEHQGEPAWQAVPGEYRADLRRLIVVQGDTEPASVEQQRHLGRTAPSLYDLRNLFQVNVEEGRHLWAMVYLLHAHFGRDGRDEAEMLQRNSGDADSPRILGAFNEQTPDWLAFFMFTYFTDRDGKFQLGTLKESAFDPLARTCEFMLKEEAHHMFVGTTGVQRIVERTAALMKEHDTDDVLPHGGIPLTVVQKYLNFHFSVSMDLFGSETSTNAANYFSGGVKGRWMERRRKDDHRLLDGVAQVGSVRDGRFVTDEVPALSALNLDLRNEYVRDCTIGVKRWNRALEEAGVTQRLLVPHEGFNRRVGVYAGVHVGPGGEVLDEATWRARAEHWLPGARDRADVAALMRPVYEPGKFASWISPPAVGIDDRSVDFSYVRIG